MDLNFNIFTKIETRAPNFYYNTCCQTDIPEQESNSMFYVFTLVVNYSLGNLI